MADQNESTEQPSPDTPHDDRVELAGHPLTAVRLEKLDAHIEAGVDPYPVGLRRSHAAADLHRAHPDLEPGASTGETAAVAGRVMLHRSFGKLVFLTIEDETGRIQLFVSKGDLDADLFERIEESDVGDWVWASGEIITTKKGELSVRVAGFALLAKGLRPLPDKWHGLSDIEKRSRQRYLDLIVNEEAREVARARSRIVSELRRQFERRGFIEVETPVLQPEAGGALAKPFATHHNALGLDMYLRIATELHLKRLIVGGLGKVFEIGRIFRNEGIDATHNPEFTMLESYEALADYEDVMELVEGVFSDLSSEVMGRLEVPYQGETIDLTPPYRRVTMLDLVNEAIGDEVSYDTPIADLRAIAERVGASHSPSHGQGKLIAEIFEAVAEPHLTQPTFVTEHPVETSPLARRHRSDPAVTERFELIIAGSEYANGYTELNDPAEQRARFAAQAAARSAGADETHPIDEDYLRALEYGMPPTGGLGIGVDRLVMLLTDQTHIREVILFPTLRPEGP